MKNLVLTQKFYIALGIKNIRRRIEIDEKAECLKGFRSHHLILQNVIKYKKWVVVYEFCTICKKLFRTMI